MVNNSEEMVTSNVKPKVPGISANFLPPLDDQLYYSILDKDKSIKEIFKKEQIINVFTNDNSISLWRDEANNKKSSSRPTVIAKCGVCGLVVQHPSKIKQHAQTHLKIKPFTCEICDEKFSRKCSLNLHIKRKHKELKEFPCTWECGKSFPTIGLLNEHVRFNHSGMRRYKCTVLECGSLFVRRQQLLSHLKNVHNIVNIS
uniref:C2H2-type domain-containing protein n=1 Tax=Parastrongyloides trichosuri TaxID=131310 RepID=A0A0N4ZGB1_PARTI